MKLRGRRGGTLGVIIACAITIVLLGVAFFFLAQIFGGEGELTHATDSGILNVAKLAIKKPGTNLNGAEEADNFGGLGDGNSGRINLLTYNRLFGQALLVALNAQRDGNGDGKAIANATKVMNALQNGQNSIGGRLSSELSKSSGNVLFSDFDATAKKNSTRQLGKDSQVTHNAGSFDVAFMEQKGVSSEPGATNIKVPGVLESLFGGGLGDEVITTVDGQKYLRGYSVPGLDVKPLGVPVNPRRQPHLVSAKDFNTETDRGGSIAFATVPPNAFRARANALEEKSNKNADAVAYSKVGALDAEFELGIPRGYIEVVNGPLSGTGSATPVQPPFAGLDHWLNNEGLTGTPVSGKIMARSEAQLEAWADYLGDQKNPPPHTVTKPSTTDVFLITGNGTDVRPATEADIENNLNWTQTTANGKISGDAIIDVVCFDNNVTGSPINQRCADLFTAGVFDKAFHPGGGYQDFNKPPATGLMSVECVKCRLQNKFNACGTVSADGCGETGLRTFACTSDGPVSPTFGQCKISQENNAIALANQVQSGFGSTIVDLVTKRLQQVKSNITAGDVQAKLEGRSLNMGDKLFLYVNSSGVLSYDSNTPPGFAGEEPDSRTVSASRSYKLVLNDGSSGLNCGMVNPHHEGGIHDIMYRDYPGSSSLDGRDNASVTLSSGYKNMLGRVQFTNNATGSATGFCKPD